LSFEIQGKKIKSILQNLSNKVDLTLGASRAAPATAKFLKFDILRQ
jgi:hypothetical protein